MSKGKADVVKGVGQQKTYFSLLQGEGGQKIPKSCILSLQMSLTIFENKKRKNLVVQYGQRFCIFLAVKVFLSRLCYDTFPNGLLHTEIIKQQIEETIRGHSIPIFMRLMHKSDINESLRFFFKKKWTICLNKCITRYAFTMLNLIDNYKNSIIFQDHKFFFAYLFE